MLVLMAYRSSRLSELAANSRALRLHGLRLIEEAIANSADLTQGESYERLIDLNNQTILSYSGKYPNHDF